jgi:diguanylate cyclase (GGDEF)-like protein
VSHSLSSTTGGRFPAALEDAYQADLAGEKRRAILTTCRLCILLYLLSAFLDAGTLPGHVAGAWIVRGTIVVTTLMAMAAVYRRPQSFLRHYTVSVSVLAFSWAAGIEAFMIMSDPGNLAWNTYYAGLILVAMALYTLTYLRPLHAGLASMAILGGYVLVAWFVQGMADSRYFPLLAQNCFFLASANLVGLVSMAMRERFSRQAFLLKNALAHDLKLEEEAKRQSQHRAEHDALTGLPNRLRFLRQLGELLDKRQGAPAVAVLFLDLDDFKPVNDRHGHAAGDHVLAAIAERIRGTIGNADLAARLGGDEFVVAVPLAEADGELAVRRMTAALRTAIAEPVEFNEQRLHVSASIGSALCAPGTGNAEELIHLADQNMYEAKRRRRRLVS